VTAEPDRTIRYGPEPDQEADVWLPDGVARPPVVIAVHGGFWLTDHDRAHLAPACAALAASGFLVCSVEYRRVGDPGGGWPGTFTDITTAIARLPVLLADGGEIGPIALLGHSAGAHLALWAAGAHRLAAEHPLHRTAPFPAAGVVSLGGIGAFDAVLTEGGLGADALHGLLGGGPDTVPERYAAADPSLLLPNGVRTILLHGSRDREVPLAASNDYAKLARAAGDRTDLRVLDGIGHFQPIKPGSPAWPQVVGAVAEIIGDGTRTAQ
jgi:acetyl esterase/lipase